MTESDKSPLSPLLQRGGAENAPFRKGGRAQRGGISVRHCANLMWFDLARLEKRYGLLSADFYHLYKAGELEQSRDFIQWVGYYEAKLDREARYRELRLSRP